MKNVNNNLSYQDIAAKAIENSMRFREDISLITPLHFMQLD